MHHFRRRILGLPYRPRSPAFCIRRRKSLILQHVLFRQEPVLLGPIVARVGGFAPTTGGTSILRPSWLDCRSISRSLTCPGEVHLQNPSRDFPLSPSNEDAPSTVSGDLFLSLVHSGVASLTAGSRALRRHDARGLNRNCHRRANNPRLRRARFSPVARP